MADWKKNKKIGVVAIVVIVLAIIFLVKTLQPQKTPALFVCEQTGELFVGYVTPETTYPIICPQGHRDGYPAEVLKLADGSEQVLTVKSQESLANIPSDAQFITDKKLQELLQAK